MIDSIHGWVASQGTILRWGLAKPSTVARVLTQLPTLDQVHVCYHVQGRPHLVSGEAFLAHYQAWCERGSTVFV